MTREASVEAPANLAQAAAARARLASLDVFRGLTIASMVLVNNQGAASYAPLRHAAWHGWTFTDTVFPFFLWIAGVALTFSFARRVEQGADRGRLLAHTLRRAAVIFGIGLALNGFPAYELSTLRIPGVLQRIAVCYAAAAAIFLYTSTARARIFWLLGCLASYTALMHPQGYEKGANFAAWVDSLLLSGHMWAASKTWDPEGLVSTLPAIATCLSGVLTGQFLRSPKSGTEKAGWLFFAGSLAMLTGAALDPLQPINKSLWTASYAILMAGMAAVTFGCCYWWIDVQGRTGRWTLPFTVFGMNALALYVVHGLLGRAAAPFKAQWIGALEPAIGAANGLLLYGLLHAALCLGIGWLMYRRRWFLKI